MAWGGFFDKKSSEYLLLLAKIERTIKNLEEIIRYAPASKQETLRNAIEILAELPLNIQEGSQ